jgi:predicted alpha-1,2-mannosidase
MKSSLLPRRWTAAAGALIVSAGVFAAPAVASAADKPGDFSSSFEKADQQPTASTAEVDGGKPVQGNLTGSIRTGLPGSVLSQVSAVTASAENPPGEVVVNLKDDDSSTKWLAFATTGWAQYQLAAPVAVVKYSLTSANDAPGRDPKNFTVQGSNNGADWTDLDSRTGQTFGGRLATNTYSFTNTAAYSYYRLNVTANSGDSIIQLADWDISDGTDSLPPATPMVSEVGSGPTRGANDLPGAGFTGTASLRYAGGAQAAGRSYATNKLFDVNIPVGPNTRLSYKIFPELTGNDLQYPSTFAAIDLHFTDGTYLSKRSPVDQHGFPLTATGQGTSKVLFADEWNAVQSDIGSIANGKTIDRILLAYDNPGATATTRFQGWIDDVTVDPAPASIDGSSLTNYVDTRRGTNASGSFSRGNNLPISALPNGFNFLTPVTDATSNSWEYVYQRNNNAANLPMLQGLAISHEPSPWMGDRNQMSIMPVPPGGNLTGQPSSRALAFSHNDEIARPDFYSVKLQNGMTGQMSPTDHGGVMQFGFAAGQTTGSLVFQNGTFTIGTDGTVTGWVDNGSGLSAGHTRMFFSGTFDRAPIGTASTSATFDTSATSTVTLRFATSFISVDQAKKNLDLEVAGKSFDQVHAAATAAWKDRLSRIEVKGASESQMVTLYSNLYRLNLYPNSQSENTGTAAQPHWQYASPVSAATGTSSATQTGAKLVDGQIYVNNGFWDTYRTVWPAYSLLYPDIAAKIADGFVQQYRDGGWIARWSSPGYADLMTGTSADVALSEAYLNGVTLPDPLAAYDAALKDATVASGRSEVGRKGIDTSLFLGYTPTSTGESVSWALEGFINDYGLGNMAADLANNPVTPKDRKLDLQAQSEYFLQRARNYVNLFDSKTQFFEGKDASGNFLEGDPLDWGGVYTETDGWNYAFTAQQDGNGLANLYGGKKGLEQKLDEFFATPEKADHPGGYGGTIHEMVEARAVRIGQLGMSNQPSHHIPYMYDYAGAPAKTQAIVREIMQRLYVGSEIGQGYLGDEDNGEMSSWYILSSLGIYPLQNGSPNWVLGSPQFTQMTVHRQAGDIVVNAQNNSPANVYVQSVKLNNVTQRSVSFDSETLWHGGTIDFKMGPKPSTWGTGANDGPVSLTKGTDVPKPLQDTTGPGLGTPTTNGGQDASKLFDDTSSTQMTLTSATPQVTWAYRGGAKQTPTFYTVTSGSAAGDPSEWKLLGSNDGVRWTTVDYRTNEVFTSRRQTKIYKIDLPGKFSQFKMAVSKTTAPQINLAEIELLAGGDVVLGGGAVTVTGASTVAARSGSAVSVPLATVTGGTASGYKATIDWGDGTPATGGTLAPSSRAVDSVSGSHTYAKPGFYQAQVTVTDGASQASATVGVDVAYSPANSLGAAFDSVCIGDDGIPGANCDTQGWEYSRQALTAAGVTQGKPTTVPGTGLSFTPPVVPANQPDNATGNGSTIALNLPSDAKNISFVGTGTEGNQNTTATVTFSDGTTATTPIQFSDWTLGGNANGTPSFGNIVVAKSAYRLHGTDKDAAVPFLFATTPYQIPAGKTAVSVTLPKQTGDPGTAGRIHVFAIADDGTPRPALALTGPKDQTATAAQALTASLGSVTGGVTDTTGYHATVEWGDGTAPAEATVDGTGAISGTHTYAQPGTYTAHVTAWDTLTSGSASFTVTVANAAKPSATSVTVQAPSQAARPAYHPQVKLSVAAGPRGTAITVDGSGFAPNETVTGTFGAGLTATTLRANGDGVISGATISVPGTAKPGPAAVTLAGSASATRVDQPFTVTN